MIRFYICILFIICAFQAKAESLLDNRVFAQLPVQVDGRIAPLDSFARASFKQFYGTIAGNQTATDWLAELLFDPEQAYARKTFHVAQTDVRHALELSDTPKNLYSFHEVMSAFDTHHDMVKGLLEAAPETVTDPTQRHILELYRTVLAYVDISRSVSLILPDFRIDDPKLAHAIGITAGQNLSYLDMIQHKAAYARVAKTELQTLGDKQPRAEQADLLKIGFLLEHMEADKNSRILQIIPPAWIHNSETWVSPWMVFATGQGSPQTSALLKNWQNMATAYRHQDQSAWDAAGQAVLDQTRVLAGAVVQPAVLKAEYIYNLTHLFAFSGLFYGLACCVFMAARRTSGFTGVRFAWLALIAGFMFHTLGLVTRIFILERPPVGTLYESILFVGWIAVAGAMLIERRTMRNLGVLLGSFIGLALLCLAPLFGQNGTTLEPLVAVLNTNFWLATHVLAITTGYGCCLITGVLAHIYLIQKIKNPQDRDYLIALSRAILIAALVAVSFATIGTVLGGIWADQSWGRFWGWDPKENGALLIVLWLLFILHGKLSGLLHADHFAIGAAATLIVVALSWFGVNLLNVGLHSYGFTSGIALYLGLFVTIELLILCMCYYLLHRRKQAVL